MSGVVNAVAAMTSVASSIMSCIVLPMTVFGHLAHVAHFLAGAMHALIRRFGSVRRLMVLLMVVAMARLWLLFQDLFVLVVWMLVHRCLFFSLMEW